MRAVESEREARERETEVCRVCEGNTDYGRTRTNRSNEGTVRNSLTMQLVPHLRTRVRKCVCVCVRVCVLEGECASVCV